jgi:hypothetical protein
MVLRTLLGSMRMQCGVEITKTTERGGGGGESVVIELKQF